MSRRKAPLRRLHARAARHMYQTVHEDGARVPWLGVVVIVAGLGVGIVIDKVLHAGGWTAEASNLGVIWSLIVATGWVIFAMIGGNGYGPDDT